MPKADHRPAAEAATATPPTPEAFRALDERYERLPLEQVVASKTNPRGHFSDSYLTQLADSIRDKGVLQPILVRPLDVLKAVGRHPEAAARNGAHFEVIAGECRFRASKLAGVTHIPAVIRDYTDEQVLEIQLIENIHRQDLSPLEQARGYRALIDSNPTKHSAESIATRIGMSAAWVWDRMKLLDLVPEAQELLEQERITVGHAILIARLKPEDQMRVIDPEADRTRGKSYGGLWQDERAGLPWDEDDPANKGRKPGKYDGLKPVSVRELESWIADHIRFDVTQAAKATPLEFEPLKARVDEAQARPGRGKKVIAITFDHFTQPEARSEDERTYGPKSFKVADGQEHTASFPRRTYTAPTCEHSVLGVVAAGDRRGQSFDVCIARDKCLVHWGKEIREREKTQKLREAGKTTQAEKRESAVEARQRREAAAGDRKRRRWETFSPALTKAVRAAVSKVKKITPAQYTAVLKARGLPLNTKPADLPLALLRDAIDHKFRYAGWYEDEAERVAWAKLLGVDVKALEPTAEAVQPSGEKGKPAKKKGRAA